LQDDSALALAVNANNTYILDGELFATASSTGDLTIDFDAPSGSFLVVGYQSGNYQGVITSGVTSSRIVIPVANTAVPIHIAGVAIVGGTDGNVQLKWAQASAVSSGTAIQAGSFLRADQL
jgi:hypothetical protein